MMKITLDKALKTCQYMYVVEPKTAREVKVAVGAAFNTGALKYTSARGNF